MNRSSRLSGALAFGLLLLAVLACSGGAKSFSFPEDKKNYIGNWSGEFPNGSMTLNIGRDGSVNYERKEGGSTKSISGGSISKFDGDNFEVKVLLITSTFKVEKPPYRDGSKWKMVVDGVELSRKAEDNE